MQPQVGQRVKIKATPAIHLSYQGVEGIVTAVSDDGAVVFNAGKLTFCLDSDELDIMEE